MGGGSGSATYPDDDPTPRRIQASAPATARSKAPSGRHYATLQACMKEALDDGDEFSRRQAVSLLNGMLALLNEGREVDTWGTPRPL